MAETGCLRNASYSHISVEGNTNSINRIELIEDVLGNYPTFEGEKKSIRLVGLIAGDTVPWTGAGTSPSDAQRDHQLQYILPLNRLGCDFIIYFRAQYIGVNSHHANVEPIIIKSENEDGSTNENIIGTTTYLSTGMRTRTDAPVGTITFNRSSSSDNSTGAIFGDYCHIFSPDGINWIVEAFSKNANGITFS